MVNSFVESDDSIPELQTQRKDRKGLSELLAFSSSDELPSRKGPFLLSSQNESSNHVSEQQIWENNQSDSSDFTALIKSSTLEAAKELSQRPKIGVIHSGATLFSERIRERLEHLSKIDTEFSIDEGIEIADAASLLKILERLDDNIEVAGQMAHRGALLIVQADIMVKKGRELLA